MKKKTKILVQPDKLRRQPVYLNVYDLIIGVYSRCVGAVFMNNSDGKPLKSLNNITLPLGFGAFHSGVQVFEREVSYSAMEGAQADGR